MAWRGAARRSMANIIPGGVASAGDSFMMNEENKYEGPRRLPLWRSCLDEMTTKSMINYGASIPAEFFEEQLKCERSSMEFGLAISNIRRELEQDGFYLSGRGQKGSQFVILQPASNVDVMAGYSRAAIDALRRGTILGTNTRLDTLSESERRRHEGLLERLATKAALVHRSSQVADVVRKHSPKLLQ